MFARAKAVYRATRKKHDQLWNSYFMRPIAAAVVVALARTPVTPNQLTILNVAIFAGAAALFVTLPTHAGGIVAALTLELSYLFDCADGMLARHKKLASKQGHLFDFFTDEIKAVLLAGTLGLRAYRSGGFGLDFSEWPAGSPGFLVGAVAAVAIIASATSLTNFLRHPDIAGRETPVEAHYETVERKKATSLPVLAAQGVATFLRFLNHYPSHIWVWAAFGRLELFFWIYAAINLLYLGRGWLGIVWRFGRG